MSGPQKRRRDEFEKKTVTEGSDGLVGFAEALLTVLAKKREAFSLTLDIEVLLRASIRAATYTTDPYFAALAGEGQSAEAANCLKRRDCVIAASSNYDSESREPSGRYCANTRNKEFGEIAYYVAAKTS